jgi:hypothetical protein
MLTVWDYLHGTVLLSVPQEQVVVGVPAYRASEEVTISRILAIPFRPQREDWAGPTGPQVERPHPPETRELAP